MKIVDHDQRRDEVAAAAAGIIASQGIEALTTRRLAQEMGCSLGVLSHYFANKNEILLAALNWAEKRIGLRLNNALQGEFRLDQLKPIVMQVLPLDPESDLEWRVRLNMTTYALTHPELSQTQQQQLQWAFELVKDLIVRFQQSGEIRADAEPDLLARTMLDMMTGLAINLLQMPMEQRAKSVEFLDVLWAALQDTAG